MDLFCISVSSLLVVLSIKRGLLLPFPTALIALLLLSQIMFRLVHEGVVINPVYQIADYGGLTEQYNYTQFLYSAIAVGSYLSMTIYVGRIELRQYAVELRNLARSSDTSEKAMLAIFWLVLIHLALFLYVADWQKLWLHHNYLEPLVDRDVANFLGLELTSLIVKVNPFVFLASIFGFFLSLYRGTTAMRGAFFALSFFYFAQELASNSRFATAYPVFLALFCAIGDYRFKKIVIPFLVVIGGLSLTFALRGRSSGAHGFAAIFDTVGLVFAESPLSSIRTLLLNVTEGIYETSESLQVQASFPGSYMIRSFSPLPSFVDGFRDIAWLYQVRLNEFMPMSGLGEVHHFGRLYGLFLLSLYILIIRMHVAPAIRSGSVFILCNILIALSIYHLLAYPIRNAVHFAWLAFFIILGLRAAGTRSYHDIRFSRDPGLTSNSKRTCLGG